jgi:ribosomal protein S18 acetylase RimI-like enzyme
MAIDSAGLRMPASGCFSMRTVCITPRPPACVISPTELLAAIGYQSVPAMAILIRKATERDADVLRALNADVQAIHAAALPWLFKPPGPDTLASWEVKPLLTEPANLFFIAEVDGDAAGYAYAQIREWPETQFTYGQDMIYLHHLSVRPAHRRHGVGSALIGAVRAAAAEAGIKLVALDVWAFNNAARTFFRRHGFAAYNERMWNRLSDGPAGHEDR